MVYKDKLLGIEGDFRAKVKTMVLTDKEKCGKGTVKEHKGDYFGFYSHGDLKLMFVY